MPYNLLAVVSNRCTYERQKVLFRQINDDPEFNLKLVLTGSLDGFNELSIGIRKSLKAIHVNDGYNGHGKTLKQMARSIPTICNNILGRNLFHGINGLISIADRFEQLPFAIMAAYLGVPIFHIQGGEVSGNIDDKVRNAISAMADYHFTSHEHAKKRLVDAGYTEVYCTGCPSIDHIKSLDLKTDCDTSPYLICLFHPHTKEIDKAEIQAWSVFSCVSSFAKSYNIKPIFFGGNNDPGWDKIEASATRGETTIIKNLPGDQFIEFLSGATMIVGNSSAGLREASYLGIPSVNIGLRQAGRVRAENVITTDFDGIQSAMLKALNMNPEKSTLFGDGFASKRIIKLLKHSLEDKCQKQTG